MSLGHTLEAVARARAAGRPDILTSPWDRVVRDEHANIIEAGGPATWTEQIVRSTCAAQVVLMGTAVDREPFLTEDAQFILSDYTIRIDTLLRGDLKASGNSVSYVRPGGAVMVKGRLVTARHARYPALEQGRSYIVFARHTDVGLTVQRSDRWVLDALSAAPVVRAVGLDAVKALQGGVDLDEVLDAIKKASCGK